ncbi:TetR/AcrR family transcriptional regulator C-terminal domain-containing protein [Streptomyces lunaelactis]|uniref:TetR/AcrR family transcriptional regulator C-terminal domain-containing protein n=1 Tax=Streptomyces lunaelactis TaxID=1535768 RepID=UPI0020C8065F|nr:TetR/AcrR family transcriptional regulator C-terminal domain-containing protein [Streptomyces lunaelactis]
MSNWLPDFEPLPDPEAVIAPEITETECRQCGTRVSGLTPTQMIHVHLALLGYAQGVAMAIELESQARQDTGMTPEQWMASNEPRMEAIQTTGAYPTLSTLFGEDEFDLELGTLFEFGLERMLDGVAALIEGPRGVSLRRTP